jgi:hypothetical protein
LQLFHRKARYFALAGVGFLVGALATAVAARAIWSSAAISRPVVRFNIPLAPDEAIRPSNSVFLAISPDGSRIAYTPIRATGAVIYVRDMDQQQPKTIPDVAGTVPMFSPDGQWLAFFHPATKTLRKVALSGGAPVVICALDFVAGTTWPA